MCTLKFEKHCYMTLDSVIHIPKYRNNKNYSLYLHNTGAFKVHSHIYWNADFTNKDEIIILILVKEKIKRLK